MVSSRMGAGLQAGPRAQRSMGKRGGGQSGRFLLGLGEYLEFEREHSDLVKETTLRSGSS